MKFHNGRWLMKTGVQPLYAAELFEHEYKNDELRMLVPSGHIAGRGSTQTPALLITLFSPAEGVIGIKAVHHKGEAKKEPNFALKNASPKTRFSETEEELLFASGDAAVKVSRSDAGWMKGFALSFFSGGKALTRCGFQGIAYMADENTGKRYMRCELDLDVGECVYGFGENFTSFVKNGQTVDTWMADGGTSSEQAYKNVPFYMTNRGYGVFVDTPADVTYEIATENVEKAQFAVEGESVTFYILSGPRPADVLRRYTGLTGRPALPPAWSFGLWLSTSFTTDYDEKTVMSFLEGMQKRDIPVSVFHFDCFWMRAFRWCDFLWDGETFPDPEGLLARLKARGLRICLWLNPYISQYSRLFDEGAEKGYLVLREDGSVWQTDLWQTGMGLVDFTNPEAREWYAGYLRGLLRMGADCFKTDFGERIPVRGIRWHDGGDPVRMHNYYTYLYNETMFRVLEEERGEGEAVLFARSATAGCQRFPLHWGGDNSGSYASMAETLRGGLSMAMSGFGFWSHDIAGFEQTAPADVYKRWCQFGLLSSHSRLHGSQSYRVPWLFDDEASAVLGEMTKRKNALMPYLYDCARQAHEDGAPVMRPMPFEFPEDAGCDTLERQYMLGPSLLVAPVFHEDGHVEYYLPEGRWTHYIDGRVIDGGRWMREEYDFRSLPLWVRPATILAVGARCDRPDYDYCDGLTLQLYGFSDGDTAEISVPDTKGNVVLRAKARREGGKLLCSLSGNGAKARFISMEEGLNIEIEE